MINITGNFSLGAFLCRNLLGHEPCHDFNPQGSGKRLAKLNTRFNNLVKKYEQSTEQPTPPPTPPPTQQPTEQPTTGGRNDPDDPEINYILNDFLYFNNYDMNNFSFLELLELLDQKLPVPSKLKKLNDKFVNVFKLNISDVVKIQVLKDTNYKAIQDLIACVQEIVELSDYFRILIISQDNDNNTGLQFPSIPGSPVSQVSDPSYLSLNTQEFLSDIEESNEEMNQQGGGPVQKRPRPLPIKRLNTEKRPRTQSRSQSISQSSSIPDDYRNFIKKLNYLRSGVQDGWINSLDENDNNFFNQDEIKLSPFNFLYTNDQGNIDNNKINSAKKEITDVFKLYTVLFTYYITKFNNQDNIYSINNSNFIRYGLFSYFANKLVKAGTISNNENYFIDLEKVQFNYKLDQIPPDTLEKLLGSSNIDILDELAIISNTCPLTDKQANIMYKDKQANIIYKDEQAAIDTEGAQKGGADTIYQVFNNNLLNYQEQAKKYLNRDFNNFVPILDNITVGNQSEGSAMEGADEKDSIKTDGDKQLNQNQWKLKKLGSPIEGDLAPFRYYDNELALLIKRGLELYKDTRKPPAVDANEFQDELIEKIKERITTLYTNFNTYLGSKRDDGIEGFSNDLITEWDGVAEKLKPKHLKLVDYIKRNGARIFYGRHPPFASVGGDIDYISRPIKELNANIFDKISGIFLTFNKNKQLINSFKEIKVEEVAGELNAPFKTFVNLLLQKICNKIHTEIVPSQFGTEVSNDVYKKESEIMEKVAQGKPIGGIDGTLLNAFIDTYKDNNDVFYGTATNTQEILDKVKDGNNQTDVINNALTTKLLDKLGGTRKKISDDIIENNGTVVNRKFKMYCPVTSVLDAQGAFGSCYKGKSSPSIPPTGINYKGLPMEIIIEMEDDDDNKFLFTVNLNVSNISGGAQKVILEYYLSMSIGNNYFDTKGQQVETVVSTSQVMYLGANNTFQRALEMLEIQSLTVGKTSLNLLLDTMLDKIIPHISNKYMGDFGQELSAIVENSGLPAGSTLQPPERRFLIDGDRPSFVRAGVLFLECYTGIDKNNSSILYATEANEDNVIIVKKNDVDPEQATGGANKKKNKRNKTKRKKQKKHKKTKLVKKKYSSRLKNKTIKKRKNKNKTKKKKIK